MYKSWGRMTWWIDVIEGFWSSRRRPRRRCCTKSNEGVEVKERLCGISAMWILFTLGAVLTVSLFHILINITPPPLRPVLSGVPDWQESLFTVQPSYLIRTWLGVAFGRRGVRSCTTCHWPVSMRSVGLPCWLAAKSNALHDLRSCGRFQKFFFC